MVDTTLTHQTWLDMQLEHQRANLEDLLATMVRLRARTELLPDEAASINRAIAELRDQLAEIRRAN